jgi:zinc/manganese transport system permease protein
MPAMVASLWLVNQKGKESVIMLIAEIDGPSWDLVADFQMLTHYHFMQNAYLAGTLVAGVAGIVGYFMVLRGQSFAGHSLANVGFAGATGAALIGVSPILGLFLSGILAAFGMQLLEKRDPHEQQNDIAIGAVFAASMALGYLFLYLTTSSYGSNVYTVLFGSVLGISDNDVRLIEWGSLLVVTVMIVIARPLLFSSIDPDIATARGIPVRALSLGYLILLAVAIAVAVQVIGVLLIFSLLVTPAAIALRLTSRPPLAIAISSGLGILFTWFGLAIGYFTPYPVGFFITSFAFGTYVLVYGGQWIGRHIFHR